MFTSTTTTSMWSNFSYLLPEAFITVKKNRTKLYDNNTKVYFKHNQNFEIELFNPTNTEVLAKIWLNDKLISAAGIIVPAGKRVYLERFIDVPEKFTFKTFEVENILETKTQREKKNGMVKIAFYNSIPNVQIPRFPTYGERNNFFTHKTRELLFDSKVTNFNIDNSTNPCSEIPLNNSVQMCSLTNHTDDTIETGRVQSGGRSEQVFTSASGNFAEYSFCTFEYQILPESLKPVVLKDVRQYCVECGSRIKKSSWKYCPTCGESL